MPDDEGVAAIRHEVEAEVETAIELALTDEDADPDDLLPSVFAAHRSHPVPPAEGDRPLGFVAAIREALDLELAADPDVIVMGEDGRVGGIFRATEGLFERHGPERIRDTPLTESGFVGCGIGAALTGLRPVIELQFSDFAAVAFDQIVNQAAKLRFMMGGNGDDAARDPDGVGRRRPARRAALAEPRGARAHPGLLVDAARPCTTRRACWRPRSATTTPSCSSSRSSSSSASRSPCPPSDTPRARKGASLERATT